YNTHRNPSHFYFSQPSHPVSLNMYHYSPFRTASIRNCYFPYHRSIPTQENFSKPYSHYVYHHNPRSDSHRIIENRRNHPIFDLTEESSETKTEKNIDVNPTVQPKKRSIEEDAESSPPKKTKISNNAQSPEPILDHKQAK